MRYEAERLISGVQWREPLGLMSLSIDMLIKPIINGYTQPELTLGRQNTGYTNFVQAVNGVDLLSLT